MSNTKKCIQTKINKTNKTNKKTRKRSRGGKVIESGGYGCVFRPALKCKNSNHRKHKYVSKLMTKKHTESEYKEITRFLPIMRTIPHYYKYFMVEGIQLCSPAPLSSQDLVNYETKCDTLSKPGIGITKDNINEKLHKLDILNIPDGGLDVHDYLDTVKSKYELNRWSKSMVSLLVNGILQLNKRKCYHGDVKASNILIEVIKNRDSTEWLSRLIDWGLSFEYKFNAENMKMILLSDGTYMNIPASLYRKSYQFNFPFSCILFNETFMKKHLEYKKKPELLNDFLLVWLKERGEGHANRMVKIWSTVFSDKIQDTSKKGKQMFVSKLIVDYLTKILQSFDSLKDYFENVFLKNTDVWGFLISYYTLIENTHLRRSHIVNEYTDKRIKQILIKYLLMHSSTPIPIYELERELLQLHF